MTQDDATDVIQSLLPGQGGWADWSILDPSEAQVGIMEHKTHGPASRVILGRSRKGFDGAVQAAKETVAEWAKPPAPREKKKDPLALPQEELPITEAPGGPPEAPKK